MPSLQMCARASLCLAVSWLACSDVEPVGVETACDVAYPAAATSLYVLPWLPGQSYTVTQGNCGPASTHSGIARFAYDIGMPIGTTVVAARSGRVIGVEESFTDGNAVPGDENQVFVVHDDGTVARYYHLTLGGSLVSEGELVQQGQAIGQSGNTGNTQNPHLHFDVTETDCGEPFFGPRCVTIPITFSNTSPHPMGLQAGVVYTASQ